MGNKKTEDSSVCNEKMVQSQQSWWRSEHWGGGFVADDAGPVQFFMEATNLVLKDDSTAIKNGSNAPGSAEV
jgi:hypothetical protein